MPRDKQFFPGKAVPPYPYQGGDNYMNYCPVAPELATNISPGPEYSRPFHGVELQPSEVCPRNFIIFDQTENQSRIMYHPALKQKFPCPSLDIHAAFLQGNDSRKDIYTEMNESSSSLKEDTRDIDALMSLEEDELEEDDEVISTARTHGNYGCRSPDSCSNSYSKSSKLRLSSIERSFSECCSSNEYNEKQRKRMKRMVKALRGIVPGADKMNTAAVIDEAVVYLNSLKVEVKKLGLGSFKN
ncbi:Transcription factor bhlh [Thalictrum thalictroides]|uniref:Transcription factor bhlh n=1 Tax=Thalictrum thalictroides TaxID=46969 RepID=A0A7J6X7M1_THATH|nr:Transcription factor bhlh [Thalictrum thalictroides]